MARLVDWLHKSNLHGPTWMSGSAFSPSSGNKSISEPSRLWDVRTTSGLVDGSFCVEETLTSGCCSFGLSTSGLSVKDLNLGLLVLGLNRGTSRISGMRGSYTPPIFAMSELIFLKCEMATPSSIRNWMNATFSLPPKLCKFMVLLPSVKAWHQLWNSPGYHQHTSVSSQ